MRDGPQYFRPRLKKQWMFAVRNCLDTLTGMPDLMAKEGDRRARWNIWRCAEPPSVEGRTADAADGCSINSARTAIRGD